MQVKYELLLFDNVSATAGYLVNGLENIVVTVGLKGI